MSALSSEADVGAVCRHVRFGPIYRLVHRNKYRAAIVQLAGGNQAALS
jgi:hypothetical protein